MNEYRKKYWQSKSSFLFFYFYFFQNCTQTDLKHASDGVAKEEIIITAIKFLENMTQHNTLNMIFIDGVLTKRRFNIGLAI